MDGLCRYSVDSLIRASSEKATFSDLGLGKRFRVLAGAVWKERLSGPYLSLYNCGAALSNTVVQDRAIALFRFPLSLAMRWTPGGAGALGIGRKLRGEVDGVVQQNVDRDSCELRVLQQYQ